MDPMDTMDPIEDHPINVTTDDEETLPPMPDMPLVHVDPPSVVSISVDQGLIKSNKDKLSTNMMDPIEDQPINETTDDEETLPPMPDMPLVHVDPPSVVPIPVDQGFLSRYSPNEKRLTLDVRSCNHRSLASTTRDTAETTRNHDEKRSKSIYRSLRADTKKTRCCKTRDSLLCDSSSFKTGQCCSDSNKKCGPCNHLLFASIADGTYLDASSAAFHSEFIHLHSRAFDFSHSHLPPMCGAAGGLKFHCVLSRERHMIQRN
ncbi:unnamed protein product [Trichogramma brassicae]|uniref:Uncharacterized protein n=1 Tax=Trichogramma brassicae TaxID=86971 RepID=A0A6H5I5F0_9HYME|nr:unnamed protein product [Trichogramma brassicae]